MVAIAEKIHVTINPAQTQHRPELVHETAFIAAGAMVIGDVTLAEHASVWFNAVIRGDSEAIRFTASTCSSVALPPVDRGSHRRERASFRPDARRRATSACRTGQPGPGAVRRAVFRRP